MVTLTEIEALRKVVQEELEPVKTKLESLDTKLESVKKDGVDTRMKVNQMYDAMEKEGYRFPKP